MLLVLHPHGSLTASIQYNSSRAKCALQEPATGAAMPHQAIGGKALEIDENALKQMNNMKVTARSDAEMCVCPDIEYAHLQRLDRLNDLRS